jgi:hypothetical protein
LLRIFSAVRKGVTLQPFSPFAAAPMLDWLLKDKQITPHVSVLDRSNREGASARTARA